MKITIREENESGTEIRLHSDNIRIGDYVIPSEALFLTMRLILRDVKRLGEKCEFVLLRNEQTYGMTGRKEDKEDKMKFTIFARQTNSTNTADGYTDWQEVDEWDAENAETAIDQWMDNMRYVDDRFVQTGASSYRLDDIEFDVKAENN